MIYDIVITGTGCSGLNLAYFLIKEGVTDLNVLLIDKDQKDVNDRTWSFWDKEDHEFSHLSKKKWSRGLFVGEKEKIEINFSPMKYHMIKSSDWYSFVKSYIKENSNFEFIQEEVKTIISFDTEVEIETNSGKKIRSKKVFDSTFDLDTLKKEIQKPLLLQHFEGWIIETNKPVFNANEIKFMDFSIDQNSQTRFMYVLPFAENKALVEFTLFTPELIEEEEYKAELKKYITKGLKIDEYTILEKEKGIIPMTGHHFKQPQDDKISYIGTKAGYAKGSTGYAFQRSIRYAKEIAKSIAKGKEYIPDLNNRFLKYDTWLLNILYHKNHLGRDVFTNLFKRNEPLLILKFLDEQTTFREELGVMVKSPQIQFMKAILRDLKGS